jgi:microcin C transport system permease protein
MHLLASMVQGKNVITYILRRLILMVPTFFVITLISFFLMQMAPGGPLEVKMRAQSSGGDSVESGTATIEAKEALARLYGFDKPIGLRYLHWLKNLLSLDFGESLFEYRPVSEMIGEKLLIALLFGVPATVVSYLVSMVFGILKAIYQGSWFDRLSTLIFFTLYSIPTMVVGIILIVIFSIKLDMLPVVGLHDDQADSFGLGEYLADLIRHFILPFTCYVMGSFAFLTELTKKSMLDELRKDYCRTARAKGQTELLVFGKHAFRNALIPLITSLRNVLVGFLGASFIVEMMFSIPGLGYLGYTALLNRDYPVIMANLTITALLGMLSMLIADVLYTLVDPRIDLNS